MRTDGIVVLALLLDQYHRLVAVAEPLHIQVLVAERLWKPTPHAMADYGS